MIIRMMSKDFHFFTEGQHGVLVGIALKTWTSALSIVFSYVLESGLIYGCFVVEKLVKESMISRYFSIGRQDALRAATLRPRSASP